MRAVELFAVAKAAGEAAARGFELDEARLLKHLLHRLIRGSLNVVGAQT